LPTAVNEINEIGVTIVDETTLTPIDLLNLDWSMTLNFFQG